MSQAPAPAKTTDQGTLLAEERTDLAVERSRIAAERTMMAWIRTSLSMISFGFTIYKFFQYIRESKTAQTELPPQGPRNLGLTLIVFGVVVLMAATIQHRQSIKKLTELAGHKLPFSLSLATAITLALGGILVFISLRFRFGPF